jgi:hypothetical protein
MTLFYFNLVVGVCLTALLLAVFFKTAGKSRKQKLADRDLIFNLGDEGLLRLYDQAETDNERDGILEFVMEKLHSGENYDLMPAGTLNPEEMAPPETMPDMARQFMPGMAAQTQAPTMPWEPELDMTQIMPQVMPQMPLHQAEQETSTLSASERRQITGMMAAESPQVAEDRFANTMPTHELPLDKMDWAAIEEALEKKREEYARIMAHNQLIQDVFSKIQSVESRLIGNKQDSNQ